MPRSSHWRARDSSAWSFSRSKTLSLGANSHFFFKPLNFHLSSPYFFIQFLNEFVFILIFFLPFIPKNLWSLLHKCLFPLRDLNGVKFVLSGKFIDGELAA